MKLPSMTTSRVGRTSGVPLKKGASRIAAGLLGPEFVYDVTTSLSVNFARRKVPNGPEAATPIPAVRYMIVLFAAMTLAGAMGSPPETERGASPKR